jgi:hypothetical protein
MRVKEVTASDTRTSDTWGRVTDMVGDKRSVVCDGLPLTDGETEADAEAEDTLADGVIIDTADRTGTEADA